MPLHTGGIACYLDEAYKLPEQINPSVVLWTTAPFTQGSLWLILLTYAFSG